MGEPFRAIDLCRDDSIYGFQNIAPGLASTPYIAPPHPSRANWPRLFSVVPWAFAAEFSLTSPGVSANDVKIVSCLCAGHLSAVRPLTLLSSSLTRTIHHHCPPRDFLDRVGAR
jgi:hypothetical protein